MFNSILAYGYGSKFGVMEFLQEGTSSFIFLIGIAVIGILCIAGVIKMFFSNNNKGCSCGCNTKHLKD
jgi:hypothetical protein